MAQIAPSILNSDFLELGRTIEMINNSQAEMIHMDVMDGSFVPNISFGIPIVEATKKLAKKPLDVHLMIVNPEKYIDGFRKAGADIISVHFEACRDKNLKEILLQIRESGAKPALVINPDTPVEEIFDYVHLTYMVLIMSVFPGFGGQKFMEITYDRVSLLKQFIVKNKLNTLIEVDGGVGMENIGQLRKSGADVFVVGSVIFRSQNQQQTIADLKALIES